MCENWCSESLTRFWELVHKLTVHLLWTIWHIRVIHLTCQLCCWITSSKWVQSAFKALLFKSFEWYLDFLRNSQVKSSHEGPLWPHIGIHFVSPILVMSWLPHGIQCFVNNLSWSCMAPHDCENARLQVTWHACFQCLISCSLKCTLIIKPFSSLKSCQCVLYYGLAIYAHRSCLVST